MKISTWFVLATSLGGLFGCSPGRPAVTTGEGVSFITESIASGAPVVVNLWASW